MPDTVLEIEDLIKTYASPRLGQGVSRVIDVPRFSMDAGQQIALSGESGSGKTTLLNLIAGILRPDAGYIRLAGREVGGLSEAERDQWRAQTVGYVFQTFNLLQGYTALDNVKLGMMFSPSARVDDAFARHLLERMGLADRLHHRPAQLSIGQQQRIAIARAVANRPKLVLADEPTGNLDHDRALQALELIRQLCAEQNAALLWVSHDRSLLGEFDDVRQLSEINRAAAGAVK